MIRRSTVLVLVASLIGGACAGASTSPDEVEGVTYVASALARRTADPAGAESAAAAVNALAGDIYGFLATKDDNLVFSPASIMLALAMTRAGAVGETASEMDAVLHALLMADVEGGMDGALNALSAELSARAGDYEVGGRTATVELVIANSLWGQDGSTWQPTFLDILAREYGAGMRTVDYIGATEKARRAINGWVDATTKHRIPELLGAGSLTPDSRLTLVNAIYMKAPWKFPFTAAATKKSRFTSRSGATGEVDMMRGTESLRYVDGSGWQAVELPYADGRLAMTIVLPDEGMLDVVEGRLPDGLLDDVARGLTDREVDLSMPRFDLETRAELADIMKALGMVAAFDPSSADFSGMSTQERLFINFIIHQANITVDEEGTEAAAATAVGVGTTAHPGETVKLVLDRPFIYAVRDTRTGAVLFIGRVGDPAS